MQHMLQNDVTSAYIYIHKTQQIQIEHEHYDRKNAKNEIALLKLWEEVPIGDNVQVACLPRLQSFSYPYPNTKRQQAQFAGWGRNESNSSVGGHKELKNMRMQIYDPSDPSTLCNRSFYIE